MNGTTRMADHKSEGFFTLVGDLQDDLKRLIKKEIDLAKTEMGEKFGALRGRIEHNGKYPFVVVTGRTQYEWRAYLRKGFVKVGLVTHFGELSHSDLRVCQKTCRICTVTGYLQTYAAVGSRKIGAQLYLPRTVSQQ